MVSLSNHSSKFSCPSTSSLRGDSVEPGQAGKGSFLFISKQSLLWRYLPELITAVQHDCHRAVIMDFHLHGLLKASGSHLEAAVTGQSHGIVK